MAEGDLRTVADRRPLEGTAAANNRNEVFTRSVTDKRTSFSNAL
jgi:hypothetical protein